MPPQLRPLAARPPIVVGLERQQLAAGADCIEPPYTAADTLLAGLDPADLAGLEELEDEEDVRLLEESAAYEVNGRSSVDNNETIAWLRYTG